MISSRNLVAFLLKKTFLHKIGPNGHLLFIGIDQYWTKNSTYELLSLSAYQHNLIPSLSSWAYDHLRLWYQLLSFEPLSGFTLSLLAFPPKKLDVLTLPLFLCFSEAGKAAVSELNGIEMIIHILGSYDVTSKQ